MKLRKQMRRMVLIAFKPLRSSIVVAGAPAWQMLPTANGK